VARLTSEETPGILSNAGRESRLLMLLIVCRVNSVNPWRGKMPDFSVAERKAFGKRLGEIRGHRSMATMADRAGISTAHWSKLENGTGSNPSETLIALISLRENVAYDWLIAGAGPKQGAGVPGSAGGATARKIVTRAVEETYKCLTEEELTAAIRTLAGHMECSELDVMKNIVIKRVLEES